MADTVLRALSWNCGERADAWETARDAGADAVLLQRAPAGGPPARLRLVAPHLEGGWPADPHPWGTAVAVREGVEATGVPLAPLGTAKRGQLGVSAAGSLAVAEVAVPGEPPVHLVSAYAAWEDAVDGAWGYPDAAAHRLVSDLSALVGEDPGHRVLVCGDWNVTRAGDASSYWQGRYDTVFARLAALGLRLVGPRADDGGPVPTYREADGSAPRQLDFVLASAGLADRVQADVLAGFHWEADHRPLVVTLVR